MALNTTPRTWVASEIVSATNMNTEIRDALTGIQAAWDTYTPVATNFTVGSGTLVGRWLRIGKTALIRVNFNAGGTSSYTASQMTISLPAAAHATSNQGLSLRMDGGTRLIGDAVIAAGASTMLLEVGAGLNAANSTAGQNPGTTGTIMIWGEYQLA